MKGADIMTVSAPFYWYNISMSGWRDVPALVRRCVVSVYGKTSGGGPDGVVRAFKICRDQLAKHGYLYPRGNDQILESIILTGKGYERDLDHNHSGHAGEAKDLMFSNLFEMIEPRLYEYDGRGGKQAPRPQPSIDGISMDEEAVKIVDNPGVLGEPGLGGVTPGNKPPKR